MPVFKMNSLINLLLTCGISASLLGCNIPHPQKRDDTQISAASFYFDAFEGNVVDTKLTTSFQLPHSKTYSMNLCLKDVQYSKAILSHKFKIMDLDQEFTSDGKGCITWSEKVEFNYLGKSQYVLINRTVKAIGYQNGAIQLKIAMNPWSHGETLDRAFEISKTKIENVNADIKAFSENLNRPLWIEKASLFAQQETIGAVDSGSGVKIVYEFQTVPQILLTKMNGEKALTDLKDGKFKTEFSLIQSMSDQGKEVFSKLSNSDIFESSMKQGQLSQKVTFMIPKKAERGLLYLGVKISPIDGPAGLQAFQGLYLLGDARNLKVQATFVKLQSQATQKENFDLDKDLNLKALNLTDTPTSFRSAGIVVDKLKFTFAHVGIENANEKEIFYKINACLTNGVDSQVLKSEKIKLSGPGVKPDHEYKTTDQNGCIEWTESINYNYWACQHPIAREVNVQSEALNYNQNIKYFVNPWDAQGRLAWDSRWETNTDQIYKKCDEKSNITANINIKSYRLTNLALDYSFDNLMNLTTTRKIRIELDPTVHFLGNLQYGRKEVENLRDGFYLLRLAVVKNKEYIKEPSLVMWSEKIVSVVDGHIAAEMNLATQDLKTLVATNDLLIEIAAINEKNLDKNTISTQQNIESLIIQNSSLSSQTFTGQISFRDKSFSQALVPFKDSNIRSILANDIDHLEANNSVILKMAELQKNALLLNAKILQKSSSPAELAQSQNSAYFNIKKSTPEFEKFRKFVGISPQKYMDAQFGDFKDIKSPTVDTFFFESSPLDVSRMRNEIYYEKISPYFAQRLCEYWFGDILKNTMDDRVNKKYTALCLSEVKKDPAHFFQTDSVWWIDQVGKTDLVNGTQRGLSVSSNYNLRKSFSESVGSNKSLSSTIAVKFFDFITLGFAATYQMQWSTQDGESHDQANSVSESIPLNVTETSLNVQINSHEKCLMIHLNPRLYTNDNTVWFKKTKLEMHKSMNTKISPSVLINKLTRGVLLCSGEKVLKPIIQQEKFYLIAQDNYMSETYDGGNMKNNMFFMALRGNQDYERFKGTVKAQLQIPASTDPEDAQFKFITDHIAEVFKSTASFPGFYIKPAK